MKSAFTLAFPLLNVAKDPPRHIFLWPPWKLCSQWDLHNKIMLKHIPTHMFWTMAQVAFTWGSAIFTMSHFKLSSKHCLRYTSGNCWCDLFTCWGAEFHGELAGSWQDPRNSLVPEDFKAMFGKEGPSNSMFFLPKMINIGIYWIGLTIFSLDTTRCCLYILEDFRDPQAIYITRPVVQGPRLTTGHTSLFAGLWRSWWHHFVRPGLRSGPCWSPVGGRTIQLYQLRLRVGYQGFDVLTHKQFDEPDKFQYGKLWFKASMLS